MQRIYCALVDYINDRNSYGLLTKRWKQQDCWVKTSESFTKILLHFNTSTWEDLECNKVGPIQICNFHNSKF